MIRYSIIAVFLLLASFLVQQFLPAFTGMYHSRILLVQLMFLCVAVTVGSPAMLLMAFIGGFLWDCHCALGPHGGDPDVYDQPAESLRFGYSILLFGAMGFLMQGIQPLFQQGKWQFSAILSGIAVFLYLAAEYMLINFVRGNLVLTRGTVNQMLFTSVLTMIFSPIIFWILFQLAKTCDYSIYPEAGKKRRGQH
jgi:cell shape-determining protein MreD